MTILELRLKKIVTETRTVGKAKMYRLNLRNPVVKKFIDYYWTVVDSVVRRENKIEEEQVHESTYSSLSAPVSVRSL